MPSPDVYENHENLSIVAIGDVPRSVEPQGISESGVAVWTGFALADWIVDIYKDTTNLTAPIFRPRFGGGYVIGNRVRVDRFGRALYHVRTSDWPWLASRVFVDDFDLSLDVLGEDVGNYRCRAVEMGPNGHVFWLAQDMRTYKVDVYLSTLVPEPGAGVALPAAFVILLLRWRRR